MPVLPIVTASVAPEIATILPQLMMIAAQLTLIGPNLAPIRTEFPLRCAFPPVLAIFAHVGSQVPRSGYDLQPRVAAAAILGIEFQSAATPSA